MAEVVGEVEEEVAAMKEAPGNVALVLLPADPLKPDCQELQERPNDWVNVVPDTIYKQPTTFFWNELPKGRHIDRLRSTESAITSFLRIQCRHSRVWSKRHLLIGMQPIIEATVSQTQNRFSISSLTAFISY